MLGMTTNINYNIKGIYINIGEGRVNADEQEEGYVVKNVALFRTGRKFTIVTASVRAGTKANAIHLPFMETKPGYYVGYWTVPANMRAAGAHIEVTARDHFGNETRQLAAGKLYVNVE